jgi:voltage-gated potassium channel
VLVVVIAGVVEALVDTKDFSSTWERIWWAVVTVTTVGYGDKYPMTLEGRIIAMVVMLFGIGSPSALTATIASRFVKKRSGETEEILTELTRIESKLAELNQRLARPGTSS